MDFSPRVNFQCRLLHVPVTLCAIACINIRAHVKDPVVHVRVQWIIATLKYPACTVGWVADSVAVGFPRGGNPNFPWKKSHWDNAVVKSKSKKVKIS